MMAAARLVEYVGVGAYLGAAHLVPDPRVLSAAASIATIEARHQTVLNMFNSAQPIPQAFDIPLLPQEVLAIAGPLISGCDLGVPGTLFISDDPS
jgi:Ferritin-like domain